MNSYDFGDEDENGLCIFATNGIVDGLNWDSLGLVLCRTIRFMMHICCVLMIGTFELRKL